MTLDELVPVELHDEFLNDEYVNTIFQSIRYRGGTREQALILCVKELVKVKAAQHKMLTEQILLQTPSVIIYKDKT